MIEARLRKRFREGPDSAPFELDIELDAGEGVTVLFGPSGSGKTLTLDCVAGFVLPDSGRILIDNRLTFDAEARVNLPPQARRCGYVFQSYALFPHMTLRQNLAFAAAGIPRRERHRAVAEMLERFRLADIGGRKPHELSGGQKQRGSIARSLIGNPSVLLLDEPARGLDAPLMVELYAILRQVRQEFKTPVLLVTHNLDECFELADRMLVLRDGRVVQSGKPADVAASPMTLDMAHLLGIFNIIPAEIRALDPSRNTSVLRIGDFDITGEYYRGHLKGDRVNLLATARQLRALPLVGRPGPNQVPARLLRSIETADGARLEFEGGIEVECTACRPRDNEEWAIEFPAKGLRVL